MSLAPVDGVQRLPPLNVKVVVVGAGVGGLWTALECWRKGCDVVVLEKAAEISTLGDFFTIPPSGLTTLKCYPSMHADYHRDVYDCSISIWRPEGNCVMSTFPEWKRFPSGSSAPDVNISFLKQRPVFTKMLYDQCVRLGIVVEFQKTAQSITENDGGVTVHTSEGEEYTADVCVASDGVGASFAHGIIPGSASVLDSGYAVARAAFPSNSIMSGSAAQELLKNVKNQPEFRTYLGDDLHLILFLTKDYSALAYTHKSDGKSAESWKNLRDASIFVDELLEKAKGWDPAVLDFLKQIPSKVVDYGLRWCDPVEQWASDTGRVVRLGDAAHSFLPTAGNGAVQASEDAVSLAECLRLAGKQNVHWATKVHNKLRFERTSLLQQAGFVNRDELHHANLTEISSSVDAGSVDVGFFKQGKWVWGHNPEKYATENYAPCLAHLQNGAAFRNTNLPPGHIFHLWTMESENKRMAAGIPSDLKSNGYWGV